MTKQTKQTKQPKKTKQKAEHQVSLDQALKDCRLVAKLSIEDIAAKLNLKISVIRDIEENLEQVIAEDTYPQIYLRGYLTNYGKAVKLPGIELYPQYQQLSIAEKPLSSLKKPNFIQENKKLPKKKIAIIAVVLIIVISSVSFLFNSSSESNLVDSPIATHNAVMQLPENVQETHAAPQPKSADLESEPENDIVPVTESVIDPEITEVQQTSELQQVSVVENEVFAEPETEHTLTLKFNAECWTEILDAEGNRLAFGLYKPGRELTLAGTPPFNLKLGNPMAVELYYQNELVEKTFKEGRTTRFNLPE